MCNPKDVDGPAPGGCVEWDGPISSVGTPRDPESGRSARMDAWIAAGNEPPAPGYILSMVCENRMCMNLKHVAVVRPTQVKKYALRIGGRCRSGKHRIDSVYDLRITGSGTRQCYRCWQEANQARSDAKRAAIAEFTEEWNINHGTF